MSNDSIRVVGNTEIILDVDSYQGKTIWGISINDIDTGESVSFGLTPKVGLGLSDLILEQGAGDESD